MITLSFQEFFKENYKDPGFVIYFVKNADQQALYIGISKNSIWQRWFGNTLGHMPVGFDGQPHGTSHIGQVIENNFPNSWCWTIDLLTEDDCADLLGIKAGGDIQFYEEGMIKKFSPLFNVSHLGGYHEDPAGKKKLDDEYKKIFG